MAHTRRVLFVCGLLLLLLHAGRAQPGPPGNDIVLVESWSALTTYAAFEVVEHDGRAYKCILGHLNQEPPNPTYWTSAFLEVGPPGLQGVTGCASPY